MARHMIFQKRRNPHWMRVSEVFRGPERLPTQAGIIFNDPSGMPGVTIKKTIRYADRLLFFSPFAFKRACAQSKKTKKPTFWGGFSLFIEVPSARYNSHCKKPFFAYCTTFQSFTFFGKAIGSTIKQRKCSNVLPLVLPLTWGPDVTSNKKG